MLFININPDTSKSYWKWCSKQSINQIIIPTCIHNEMINFASWLHYSSVPWTWRTSTHHTGFCLIIEMYLYTVKGSTYLLKLLALFYHLIYCFVLCMMMKLSANPLMSFSVSGLTQVKWWIRTLKRFMPTDANMHQWTDSSKNHYLR